MVDIALKVTTFPNNQFKIHAPFIDCRDMYFLHFLSPIPPVGQYWGLGWMGQAILGKVRILKAPGYTIVLNLPK